MIPVLTVLFALFSAPPPRIAICPFDGTGAGATGRVRIERGQKECQFKHVHFRLPPEGLLVEEPHMFWVPCK